MTESPEATAKRLLPCKPMCHKAFLAVAIGDRDDTIHMQDCPFKYRPAVAAALAEAYNAQLSVSRNDPQISTPGYRRSSQGDTPVPGGLGGESGVPGLRTDHEETAKALVELAHTAIDDVSINAVAAALAEAQAMGKPYTNIIQREMLEAKLVEGLRLALEVIDGLPDGLDCSNAIQAEIDKVKP